MVYLRNALEARRATSLAMDFKILLNTDGENQTPKGPRSLLFEGISKANFEGKVDKIDKVSRQCARIAASYSGKHVTQRSKIRHLKQRGKPLA
jgi:hypothetical protein